MDVSKREENIIKQWKKNNAFKKSITKKSKDKRFVFYEGPPTANGAPGLHHVLSRSFKDAVCRYKTMQGYRVARRAGWDTHGLPVEIQVEKELGLKYKKDIEEYGIAKFNKKCRESVWKYKEQWEELTNRMGFWIDMEKPYITYDPLYIESLWNIFSNAYKQDLFYEGHSIVPFCSRCGTSLSSHEVAQGYEDVVDETVFVKFPLANSESIGFPALTAMLVWTTTPWTLPANIALAVGKDINYVLVKQEEEYFIVAEDIVDDVIEGDYKIEKAVKGEFLADKKYLPPFDSVSQYSSEGFIILEGDFVNTTEGTGIVHIAPMYGEDDYQLAQKHNIPYEHTVTSEGIFKDSVKELAGERIGESTKKIIDLLKEKKLLYRQKHYKHSYPFCWRCGERLIYYGLRSWFLRMSQLKDKLIEKNQEVKWVPEYIKDGRFGEWLESLKDWTIARSRYWGTPLPVWRCDNKECDNIKVIGSRKDLIKASSPKNEYFLMRHGFSEKNEQGILSSGGYPEKIKYNLTEKGIKQANESAKKLKKENIDLIFASPVLRSKQTAEIVSKELGVKVKYDERLREMYHGDLEGEPYSILAEVFGDLLKKRLKGGESFIDVRKRVFEATEEYEKKYQSKNILIISHNSPLVILSSASLGHTIEECLEFYKSTGGVDEGSYKKLEKYVKFPYNSSGELDFHRPYIDKVLFGCKKCKQGTMKRIPELADVWFDSGAMPYASLRYPFKNKKGIEQGNLFPADFITEAIDQTRGWFYTLFAVCAVTGLIDKAPPYKNVISLGHVLDEKGKKMSKSKGNIVDPFVLADSYGMDAVRLYFFTTNSPGDVKKFIEKDIAQKKQKFVSTFDNSLVFLKTYADNVEVPHICKGHSLMDEWILAKLKQVYTEVYNAMEDYDILSASRKIESFVLDDISNWYVRRSRGIFQHPEEKKDLMAASKVLAFVLSETAKLSAPFTPFVAEYIWQELNKTSDSVHWQEWKMHTKELSDEEKKILKKMETVRHYAAIGLKLRSRASIKVRQPLGQLFVRGDLDREMTEILASEVNVKQIVKDKKGIDGKWVKDQDMDIELNILISPELEQEGNIREAIRHIQGARKDMNLNPSDPIEVFYKIPESMKNMFTGKEQDISKEVGAASIKPLESSKKHDAHISFSVNGGEVEFEIKKA